MSLGRPISKAGPARRRGRSSLEALGDEADFLRQSISDLEDEHSRGEVDESDFDLLGARYADRLAEVESAISHGKQRSDVDFEASSSSSQSSRPTARVAGMRAKLSNRRLRTVLGIAAACCFIVAATLARRFARRRPSPRRIGDRLGIAVFGPAGTRDTRPGGPAGQPGPGRRGGAALRRGAAGRP